MLIKAHSADTLRSAIASGDVPVLVVFSASWCASCRSVAQMLEAFREDRRVTVVKVAIDKLQDVAFHFDVKSVPTFVMFVKGREVIHQSGLVGLATIKGWFDIVNRANRGE